MQPILNEFSPEKTLPGGEVSALEQGVFQDSLHTTKCLNHVCTVVVQVPQLAVVPLMGPPERILLQHLQNNKNYVKHFNNYLIPFIRNNIKKLTDTNLKTPVKFY